MRYLLYIKSHCEYPDVEMEFDAKSKKQAAKYFADRLNNPSWDDGWSPEDLVQHIASDAEIAKWDKRGYGKRK